MITELLSGLAQIEFEAYKTAYPGQHIPSNKFFSNFIPIVFADGSSLSNAEYSTYESSLPGYYATAVTTTATTLKKIPTVYYVVGGAGLLLLFGMLAKKK
jgi:hypothetical protein